MTTLEHYQQILCHNILPLRQLTLPNSSIYPAQVKYMFSAKFLENHANLLRLIFRLNQVYIKLSNQEKNNTV